MEQPLEKIALSDAVVRKTSQGSLRSDAYTVDPRGFGEGVALKDHRIAFFTKHAAGKDVLDIGCVNHDPDHYKSRYWVHRALLSVAQSVVGVDLYEKGIEALRAQGFNVYVADAQVLDLGVNFDVIVAGDVIAHLEDLHGFFESAKKHLRPAGKLLITTPNPWNWRLLMRSAVSMKTCGNPEQACWVCPETLRRLARRHGMTVQSLAYSSGPLIDRLLPLPAGWRHSTIQAVVTVD